MRFAVGAFLFALGYTMAYYAIGLFQNYYPADTTDNPSNGNLFFPFSYLLGFPDNGKGSGVPFSVTPMPSGGNTTAGNTQSGGGVQLV